MTITIADTRFDHVHYDPRGDVLYLNVQGYSWPPAVGYTCDEGHGVEFDETGRLISLVIVGARWYLARDGVLTITLPAEHLTAAELAGLASATVSASAEELAPALTSAA